MKNVEINCYEDLLPFMFGAEFINGDSAERMTIYKFVKDGESCKVNIKCNLDLYGKDVETVIFAAVISSSYSISANMMFCGSVTAKEIVCDRIYTGALFAERCEHIFTKIGTINACKKFTQVSAMREHISCRMVDCTHIDTIQKNEVSKVQDYFSTNSSDVVLFLDIHSDNICFAMRNLDMQFYFRSSIENNPNLYSGDIYIKGVKEVSDEHMFASVLKNAANLYIIAPEIDVLGKHERLIDMLSGLKNELSINLIVGEDKGTCNVELHNINEHIAITKVISDKTIGHDERMFMKLANIYLLRNI
ncbi:MAG: hypothetical protein R3Y32_00025 [Bacillota bacterium]